MESRDKRTKCQAVFQAVKQSKSGYSDSHTTLNTLKCMLNILYMGQLYGMRIIDHSINKLFERLSFQ